MLFSLVLLSPFFCSTHFDLTSFYFAKQGVRPAFFHALFAKGDSIRRLYYYIIWAYKKAAGAPDSGCLLFFASASVEALVEALDASAGIDQLLLAREERVALGADFNLDVLLRGKHLDDVAAVAGDRGLFAVRMDAFSCHDFHLFH